MHRPFCWESHHLHKPLTCWFQATKLVLRKWLPLYRSCYHQLEPPRNAPKAPGGGCSPGGCPAGGARTPHAQSARRGPSARDKSPSSGCAVARNSRLRGFAGRGGKAASRGWRTHSSSLGRDREHGGLLSGLPLKVSPDVNWRHKGQVNEPTRLKCRISALGEVFERHLGKKKQSRKLIASQSTRPCLPGKPGSHRCTGATLITQGATDSCDPRSWLRNQLGDDGPPRDLKTHSWAKFHEALAGQEPFLWKCDK